MTSRTTDPTGAPAGGAESREALTGFIVPHADEHQSEYLPPSAERLAWLTGFTGSAGMAIVLADRRACSSTAATRCRCADQVDAGFAPEHLIETPPAKWLWAHAQDRRPHRLRSVADDGRRGEPLLRGLSRRPAPSWSPRGEKTRSTGSGPTGRRRRWRRCRCIRSTSPARKRPTRSPGCRRRLRRGRSTRRCWPRPIRSPGLLNIRGGDVAHNPVALAFAILPASGKPSLFIDGRKLSNACAPPSPNSPTCAEPASARGALAALGEAKRTVLLDPRTTPRGGRRRPSRRPAARSSRAPTRSRCRKARKNATEIAGPRRAICATARRWCASSPGSTRVRADRHGRRDRGRGKARGVPRRDRKRRRLGAARHLLRHDLRRRPERRHRPLPASAERPPPAGAGLALSGRFRRASIATAPPTSPAPCRSARRRAEMRDRFTRVLKGHIAHRHGALSRRHQRRPARHAGAACAVAGGPRLRPRHRPRRRRVPRPSTRGRRASPSAARCRSSRA